MAFKPQKPGPDFGDITGHQVHQAAPTPKPVKREEPSVPASGQFDSANLKKFSYDRVFQVLTLTFHDHNRKYEYAPVSPTLLRGLIDAASPTDYFQKRIKHLEEGEVQE